MRCARAWAGSSSRARCGSSPGHVTFTRRGPRRRRSAGAGLPDREAAHHARRLSPQPQRAARRLQPVDQPRPGRLLRRRHAPRRAAPARPARLDPARLGRPRGQVPPPARREAGPGARRAGRARRADAARPADARGAAHAGRAHAAVRRHGRAAGACSAGSPSASFAELQPRRPGQKEQRYAHLLSSDLEEEERQPAPAPAATWTPPSQQAPAPASAEQEDPLAERVDRLEADLAALAKQVAELRAALGE